MFRLCPLAFGQAGFGQFACLVAATFACATLAAAPAICIAGRPVVDLRDPRNDDKGPGTYVYPSNQDYHPGQFDLRRLRVIQEPDEVVFLVDIDSPIRKPPIARFSDAIEIPLENGVYVQNIDICIDSLKGQGEIRSIPGRNLRFRREEAWDVCVIATPLPYQARSVLSGWGPAGRTIVPPKVRSHDRTVEIRVSNLELGGPVQASWGYQVLITGAQWQNSFDTVNRLLGSHVNNVFAMRVTTVAERLAFGGGELTNIHPWVIDILMPAAGSQYRALSSYDEKRKRLAVIPMVYPDPVAHEAAIKAKLGDANEPVEPAAPTDSEYVFGTIKDVAGKLIILTIDATQVAAFRLGDVLDEEGQVVARLVTSQVHDGFVVATPVDGQKNILPDMKVRFPKPKEK